MKLFTADDFKNEDGEQAGPETCAYLANKKLREVIAPLKQAARELHSLLTPPSPPLEAASIEPINAAIEELENATH